MLAMLLAAFASFAQESTDDIGPAVDTSAIESDDVEPAVNTSAATDEDEQEAAVAPAGVTRQTTGNRVMDTLELGRTEITGNQELPKVLYIVPWQKADPGDLMGKPVNSLLDEVLAPLDREEFLRQVDYHGDLYGEDAIED